MQLKIINLNQASFLLIIRSFGIFTGNSDGNYQTDKIICRMHLVKTANILLRG